MSCVAAGVVIFYLYFRIMRWWLGITPHAAGTEDEGDGL